MEANPNDQTTNAKILLSQQDLKIVADKIGIPYGQLLYAILNSGQDKDKQDFGPNHPGHPRLLSVVPADIEAIINEKLKRDLGS
jgi:hypothetical protein